MPHKHKRDRGKIDVSCFDLPPSKGAHSLPVKKAATTTSNTKPQARSSKRKHARLDDDTPRAFTRLLSGYRPPRSGLDDGTRPSKKNKRSTPMAETSSAGPALSLPAPTLQPRESLSSFNARVDAALPFSGLSKKSGAGKEAEKEKKTKTERKMQKMQNEWREEERRRREKLEQKRDEAGVDEGGIDDLLRVAKKTKRKGAKGTVNGVDVMDDEEDPWAHIKAKRIQGDEERDVDGSRGGLVGLHDVVLAPPKLSKLAREKAYSVFGKGTNGLKRQVELTEARESIVEGYRQMMKDKRERTV